MTNGTSRAAGCFSSIIGFGHFGGYLRWVYCLLAVDFKRLEAYSSVAHMGGVVIALFSLVYEELYGGFYLMLAHRLVSPALFIAVTVLYDRHKTINIIEG